LEVCEGSHRLALTAGSVTLIPGARDGLIASRKGGGHELRLADLTSSVHPSGDALYESAAMVCKAPAGVVLTGMGEDGSAGAAALRRRGMPVLVQDLASCVVDGMPEAAMRAAPGCEPLSLERIADRIAAWSRRMPPAGQVPTS
jgi:two-component system chemotaxis response regulator CheB